MLACPLVIDELLSKNVKEKHDGNKLIYVLSWNEVGIHLFKFTSLNMILLSVMLQTIAMQYCWL